MTDRSGSSSVRKSKFGSLLRRAKRQATRAAPGDQVAEGNPAVAAATRPARATQRSQGVESSGAASNTSGAPRGNVRSSASSNKAAGLSASASAGPASSPAPPAAPLSAGAGRNGASPRSRGGLRSLFRRIREKQGQQVSAAAAPGAGAASVEMAPLRSVEARVDQRKPIRGPNTNEDSKVAPPGAATPAGAATAEVGSGGDCCSCCRQGTECLKQCAAEYCDFSWCGVDPCGDILTCCGRCQCLVDCCEARGCRALLWPFTALLGAATALLALVCRVGFGCVRSSTSKCCGKREPDSIGVWEREDALCFHVSEAVSSTFCCLCRLRRRRAIVAKRLRDGVPLAGVPATRSNGGGILTVYIRDAELEPALSLRNPMIRLHVVDLERGGSYAAKSDRARKMVSAKERPSATVPPILGQPFRLAGNGGFHAEWKENLVVNDSVGQLCRRSTLLLFEIVDIDSKLAADTVVSGLKYKGGFCHAAWGFLRPIDDGGAPRLNKDLSLQLFQYTAGGARAASDALAAPGPSDAPEVYYEWLYQGVAGRKKYFSTLQIRLGASQALERRQQAGLPPSHPGVEEKGRLTFTELMKNAMREEQQGVGGATGPREERERVRAAMERRAQRRRRGGLDPCRLPRTVVGRLPTAGAGCHALAFSPDGKWLAAACTERVVKDKPVFGIRVYDTVSFELQKTFVGHLELVYDLSWSGNSREIVTASSDHTAKVFSLRSGDAVLALQHPTWVYASHMHPTALAPRLVMTGAYDAAIRVWSRETGKLLARLEGHTASVNALAFSPDGQRFYSADATSAVKVWHDSAAARGGRESKAPIREDDSAGWAARFRAVQTVKVDGQPVNCVRFHAQPERLVVYTRASSLYLVSILRQQVRREFSGAVCKRGRVRFVISPDGSYLLAGSEDGKAYIWDIVRGVLISTLDTGARAPLCDVAWHPNQHLVALCNYGSGDTPIVLMDSERGADATNWAGDAELAAVTGVHTI